MAGYNGYSMSNNAVMAYGDGEKPISKWTKKDILDVLTENNINTLRFKKVNAKALKGILLHRSSWHHTGSYYNKTDFYSIDIDKAQNISDSELENLAEIFNNTEKTKDNEEEKWLCEYLEWSGTRKHPKATKINANGIVKGSWFYLDNGTKKSVNARGFKFIQKIG